ncbi:receptor-transporting protein 3 [Manis pentadactyla]|uniref:receptor-transporting protein 3 n=1 Tax=Manis pentadactyla TaxID=143292 RepID=UPI00255C545C|nr:receptor-transporting protein 3 [Manis pentadactyla]
MCQDMKVWKQVFQELIQELKPWHKWTLTLDKGLLPNVLKPEWAQYQQWVFARFQCSLCSRSWTSAQVQVLFHMHWSERERRGQVKMRVFAQRCRKCFQAPFEAPEFIEENIPRILNNLVLRILKKCYRERFKFKEEIPTIKEISLEGPHDSDNCEACLEGFCAQRELGPGTRPPANPSPPPICSPSIAVAAPVPSPKMSSSTADARTGETRVKKEKVLPSPCSSEPMQAARLPTCWNPRADTRTWVETIVQVPSSDEASLP